MRMIPSEEGRQLSNIEKYELNNLYVDKKKGYYPGFVLCYLLANDNKDKMEMLKLKEKKETNVEHLSLAYDAASFSKSFSTFEEFSLFLRDKKIETWVLNVNYEGEEIGFSGNKGSNTVEVKYPLERKVNILPLLCDLENRSFQYHSFDNILVGKIKQIFKLNQRRAISSLLKLSDYEDLFSEFVSCIAQDDFVFPKAEAIEERGYTAQSLSEKYPLSGLGAYNYLIYLREAPEEALEDLRKGLPRK